MKNKNLFLTAAAVSVAVVALGIFFVYFLQGPPLNMPFGGQPLGGQANGNYPGTGQVMPQQSDFPPKLGNAAEVAPAPGAFKAAQLGNIEITYFDTITLPGNWEYSTDIYLTLKNNGNSSETIEFTKVNDIISGFPQWAWQFFEFQKNAATLAPGDEKEIHYFISNEGEGEFSFTIDFWKTGSPSEKASATIKIASKTDARLEPSGAVYGIVNDGSGNPVSGADVSVFAYNGRERFSGITGQDGKYAILVPAIDDVKKLFGERKLPYNSLDYFLAVDDSRYSYFYKDGIYPNRTEPYRLDVTLSPPPKNLSLKLKWEKQVEEYYGFFWVYADGGWQRIAAQQAKHSPELNKPARTYMFDANGSRLWTYETGNECWGFDMLADGTAAMGCHDGKIYVVEKNGTLRWVHDSGAMVREVGFSHDGKYLVGGPAEPGYDASLFDAAGGEILESVGADDMWLRNSKFYADDKKFVAGKSSGYVAAYDISGNELWSIMMGEFPMFMDIGGNDVVYASGKSRSLYAIDVSGNVKWKYRIPDHSGGAGAISADGSRIAIGTGGGWVYLFDGSGKLLWRVKTDGESIGHNAIAITADGKYVVAGTAPQNTVFVFDEKGNKVWSYNIKPSPNPILDEKYAGIGYKTSRGTQEGVMNAIISADASKIAVAYGDNFVRMFESGAL
ncbi:MAG: PQQ-binding-like beta-propeller repeat protein [Nanoarchaeota archaeon]|nr:PQQ-binding-like beta-propeller repeat protein [Nanoarchaeota archaeon]